MNTAIIHSVLISLGSLVVGLAIVLPVAYFNAYHDYRGKIMFETLILLPLVLPPTIIGYGLLRFFGRNGLGGALLAHIDVNLVFTLTGAIISVTIVILPILYQGIKAAYLSVPKELIDAAKILSANQRERLLYIIIPHSWPSILASSLLAICRGLGEFGASLMMAGYIEGKTDTIATAMYFAVLQGDDQKAVTLSLVSLLIGFLSLGMIQLLNKRGNP
ncbi:hypothetical protein A5886_001055 [Enterococcus sp. 8G7_MSG3316]|uniref:ABC transmembrane type-1 domain-containing protein n=1 Tax=Candidatus Enterococcus testudinis TaxID=1834191 RepID=A0A242A4Y6_9ENTE|nr:ABC transporter permease subunit [Enterococcus sp. 8G7_MSG3316]OTN75979.1 hypothetical protein A5886_001055 [Enterococcus sp. 8G7_MSG3316]